MTVSHQRSSSAKEYKDNLDVSHQRSNSAKDHKEQMALQRKVERDRSVSEGADALLMNSDPVPNVAAKRKATPPQLTDDSTSIDISITSETVAK